MQRFTLSSAGWPPQRPASGRWSGPAAGVLAGLAALALGALSVTQPLAAAALALLTFLLAAVLFLYAHLPRLALGALGLCLIGYALFGRGFAYLGVAPLYVGEAALLLCLLAAALHTRWRVLAASPLTYLLGVYLLIGLVATVPQIGIYGLISLRDAVLWGYGLFALAVAALLIRFGAVTQVAATSLRFVPIFLVCAPLATLAVQLFGGAIPRLPGTDAALIEVKGGDVAVHLAGIAALLMLGLPRLLSRGRLSTLARHEWLWWALWLATAAIPVFRVRAGLLAIAAAVLIVLVLRPASRWGKPAALVVLLLTLALAFNVTARVGEDRNTISAEALLLNIQSIAGSSGEGYRDGTRGWRLRWWTEITHYTFGGPYFWTGKGYGINLADADGFQLGDHSLRSPHNGHLTILARSGVPGFAAWIVLQLTFALSLLRAYLRAQRNGQTLWARLNLFTLAYWAAFMVNASFDVYLEGPQGGIWFWCVFGFGLALLEVQRRAAATPPFQAALPGGTA
ncbi:O-antigen ligase family protein (plasmid) [Deinococcus sp. KNUC1210]|uniref:O-antigen ligase family protein n=1 Tax=Deinococcus sp. KNUC1210 TaxID=2917691 RepID=UPI001EF12B6A|nr:O-antigen ligase family protein [Deinococcus sp. KNUC1210]ULH17593.1 O-antigen ligase family protein [Deinococcus sp. KNUC1210]